MSWAIAFAAAGLLQGIGIFLDLYHISSETRDRARLQLIRGFLWIESASLPRIFTAGVDLLSHWLSFFVITGIALLWAIYKTLLAKIALYNIMIKLNQTDLPEARSLRDLPAVMSNYPDIISETIFFALLPWYSRYLLSWRGCFYLDK